MEVQTLVLAVFAVGKWGQNLIMYHATNLEIMADWSFTKALQLKKSSTFLSKPRIIDQASLSLSFLLLKWFLGNL